MSQAYTTWYPLSGDHSSSPLQRRHRPHPFAPIVTGPSRRHDSQPRSPTRLGIYDLLNHDDDPQPTWQSKPSFTYSRSSPRLSWGSDDAPPLTSDTFSEYSEDLRLRSVDAETDAEDVFEVDIVTSDDELESRPVSYAISDERGRWHEPVPKRAIPAPIPLPDMHDRFPSSSPESSCPPMTARSERSDFSFADARSASPLPPSSPMSASALGLEDERDIEAEMLHEEAAETPESEKDAIRGEASLGVWLCLRLGY
jgi:hypothetical protein